MSVLLSDEDEEEAASDDVAGMLEGEGLSTRKVMARFASKIKSHP